MHRRHRPFSATDPGRTQERHAPVRNAADGDETIQGLRAGLAVFLRRREAIVRVAFSRIVRTELLELCRWAKSQGVPCREVADAELDRIAGSRHHEGLCVLARPRPWTGGHELADRLVTSRGVCVALDRVRNPYNVGAILRTAAFFGVDAVLLGTPAPDPGLSPTAVRVAEGGVEHLAVARTTDLADTLGRLRTRGVHVIGADGAARVSVLDYTFPRPSVVVLGNEREGLGERVRGQCDVIVAVKGRGAIESLNVAVAAGVLVSRMTT